MKCIPIIEKTFRRNYLRRITFVKRYTLKKKMTSSLFMSLFALIPSLKTRIICLGLRYKVIEFHYL